MAASILVQNGAELVSLADLVSPERFKTILRYYRDQAKGEPNSFVVALATTLVQVARFHVRAEEEQVAELKRLAGLLEFIRAFQEEMNRSNAEREQQFTANRQQLESIRRKIAGIVSAIEEGDYSRALGDRLADLEKHQELLETRLSEAPPSALRLHPRLAEVYSKKVQQLEQALNDPAIRAEAADVLRSLIDRIELRPRGKEGQGIAATLHGDVAQILALCGDTGRKQNSPKPELRGVNCRWLRGHATSVVCT